MKANELRIGNLVIVTNTGGYNNIGDIISIDSISKNGVNSWSDMGSSGCNSFFGISPIPLTEEWLLKLGFINHHEAYPEENWKTKEGFCLYKLNDGFVYRELVRTAMGRVKYVHQLQNLYFALTGEELEIK